MPSSSIPFFSSSAAAPHVPDCRGLLTCRPEFLNNFLGLFRKQKALDFLGNECFPPQLVSKGSQLMGSCQNLAAVGTRQWGHPAVSGFLRVRIYDFAVYMDDKQVRDCRTHANVVQLEHSGLKGVQYSGQAKQSSLSAQYRGRLLQAMNDDTFYHTLRNSNDIDMSLMVYP